MQNVMVQNILSSSILDRIRIISYCELRINLGEIRKYPWRRVNVYVAFFQNQILRSGYGNL